MKFIKALSAIILSAFIFSGCKKDKDDKPADIDLVQAKFVDFQLVELDYENIEISHPVITNGVETERGSITVYLPTGASLNLTPETSNFANNNFTVQPGLGITRNFSQGAVEYVIVSKQDPQKKVHYDVLILADPAPNPNARITEFRFTKNRNPQLAQDIVASKIIEGVGTLGKIFIFVPIGTDYTTLIPTIDFDGAGIFYSQDEMTDPVTNNSPYPTNGEQINVRYPNRLYLVVKNGDEVASYEVIVDVRQPLKLDAAMVTTPDVQEGNLSQFLVTQIENRGNHPLHLREISHQDQVPANILALRGLAAFPGNGLLPGNKTNVFATVNGNTFRAGNYATTAVFKPSIRHNAEANQFLEPATLRINAEIIP